VPVQSLEQLTATGTIETVRAGSGWSLEVPAYGGLILEWSRK
jgi:hypothetical protein